MQFINVLTQKIYHLKSSWIFFLIDVGWSFQTASNCDFNGVIVVFSIMWPRTFTWVKKKTRFIWCCFHTFFIKIWWYLSSTLDFFILFVTAWKPRLKLYLRFRYELMFYKILLMNAEKAADLMDIPKNILINSDIDFRKGLSRWLFVF